MKHPDWLEITVDADPLVHEALSEFLFTLGCQGIAAESSHPAALKAYFPSEKLEEIRSRLDLFLKKLEEIFPEARAPKLSISKIENQDWGLAWRRFFRTEQITPGLVIVPAWEKAPLIKDARVIRMDPGPAFGTGQHATTRMCLEMMETFPRAQPWSMMDVGTGSGILAIYGAILGAGRILALDTDPEALRWAKRNIDLNQLPVPIHVSDTPVEEVKDSFHLLAANLILHVIQELVPHFSRLLEPRGWLILSGLLKDQVEGVWARLKERGLEPERVLYREEWACILAVKKGVKRELMHS
jgi:ribosomal protein L11 methyltransferase